MRNVTVAITQMASENDWTKNCDKAERLVREAAGKGANLVLLQELFDGDYFCIEQHIDYLSLEADLLYNGHPANPIAENLALLPFANQYLGKTAATAPSGIASSMRSGSTRRMVATRSPFFVNRPTLTAFSAITPLNGALIVASSTALRPMATRTFWARRDW